MDCERFRDDDWAERYLAGALSESERDAYELHFLECRDCFQELETLRAVQVALREENGGRSAAAERVGLGWRGLVFAAAAALAVVGVMLWLAWPGGPAPLLAERDGNPYVELVRLEAPAYVETRLRGSDGDREHTFRHAMEAYSAGDWDEAHRQLAAVTAEHPADPKARFYLGAAALMARRADEAVRELELCVGLGDSLYLEEALFRLAQAHLLRGEPAAALERLRELEALRGDWEERATRLAGEVSERGGSE